jgi:ABC-type dipeptide/oligopeptide/nickel transport system ATPase component
LQGEPPRPEALPSGCHFRLRGPLAQVEPCSLSEPPLKEITLDTALPVTSLKKNNP